MCMCVKSLQSCLTLCNPMDCSPQVSSVHAVLHENTEVGWFALLGGSSRPRDWTYVSLDSCTDRQVITSIILEAQCRKSWYNQIFSQFSSVAQSCLTLCDPMNRSTLGLPIHYQLPEFIQTHAHWVGDAIKPSHPLSSPSPPAPNPSQHQSLFQWVNSSHEVAKVLKFQLQQQSF